MRILCINGSPKPSKSSSGAVLKELQDVLEGHDVKEISIRKPELTEDMKAEILGSDCLVFAFPLYVDSIPSHLTYVLMQMERLFQETMSKKMVYAIVNCGFYEGHQNHIALKIMRCWCERAGLSWGQGLGIGGGGMIPMLSGIPEGKSIKKDFSAAISETAGNISSFRKADDKFISPGIPRIMYKLAGQMGWRKQIKDNGLPAKELSRKISE